VKVFGEACEALSIVVKGKDSTDITSDNHQILPPSNQNIYILFMGKRGRRGKYTRKEAWAKRGNFGYFPGG
jgi:hypothetical protein